MSATGVEDYSVEAIQVWLGFNKKTLTTIENTSADRSHDSRIDARLLARQIRSEIEDGRPGATQRALNMLETAALFYQDQLPETSRLWIDGEERTSFVERSRHTSSAVRVLAAHVRNDLLPRLTLPEEPILGRNDYARKLAIYTDSDLTPEELETMAMEEIQRTKGLIRDVATRYWDETYGDREAPRDPDEVVAQALSDLEDDRPRGEQEYLTTLREYAQGAEDFRTKVFMDTLIRTGPIPSDEFSAILERHRY